MQSSLTPRKQASIERRNEIIDAALKVFAEKGLEGATNRDIAQEAGINSPGLIYHYFESQEDLFRAVIAERIPTVQMLAEEADGLLNAPPHVVLPLIGTSILTAAAEPSMCALMRLIFGEAMRRSDISNLIYEASSAHILGFLYRYFGKLMQEGQLRQADLGATIRCFMGPIFVYVITTYALNAPDENTPTPEVLVETHIDIFLRGMQPASTTKMNH